MVYIVMVMNLYCVAKSLNCKRENSSALVLMSCTFYATISTLQPARVLYDALLLTSRGMAICEVPELFIVAVCL